MEAPAPRFTVRCCRCAAAVHTGPRWLGKNKKVLCLTCLAGEPEAPFAARLKALRLAAGWTAAELARRSGVCVTTIRGQQAGTAEPTWRVLRALVEVLGPGLVWLDVPARTREQRWGERG